MGSTLSFPILCVVNFVCYYKALENYLVDEFDFRQQELEDSNLLKYLPCLINGDDILFRCNRKFYDYWLSELKWFGFKLSVGKNYIHRNIFTMNSQMYKYDWERGKIEEFLYYNPGLLFEQTSTVDLRRSEFKSDRDLTAIYNEFIAGAMNPERAHGRFMKYHKGMLREYSDSGRLSLTLPIHLGGLGLDIPDKFKGYITRAQGLVATVLYRNPAKSLLLARREFTNADASVDLEFKKSSPGVFGPQLERVHWFKKESVTISNSSLSVDCLTRFCPINRKEFFAYCEESNGIIYKLKKLMKAPVPIPIFDGSVVQIRERENVATPTQIDDVTCKCSVSPLERSC
jgi:hypothetical protein